VLSRQLIGAAPEPTKPNGAVPFTGTLPFQDRFVKVTWLPLVAMSAAQKLPIVAPAGRSNSTFQEVMADAPVLLMVTSACQPVPQSETLTVAVGAAADAGRAIQTVPAVATAATTERIRVRVRRMGVRLQGGGRARISPIIRSPYRARR
jgi:hypothetical protein